MDQDDRRDDDRRDDDELGRHMLPTFPAGFEPQPEAHEAYGGTGEAPGQPVDVDDLRARLTAVLKDIFDPEIPVNIYDLGLIYDMDISADGNVDIGMTLTAPACPVAGSLVAEVAERTGAVAGVSRSHVRLVWDPPWTKDRMSEEAQLELGLL
jgi:FeS assembly SUF system protein